MKWAEKRLLIAVAQAVLMMLRTSSKGTGFTNSELAKHIRDLDTAINAVKEM